MCVHKSLASLTASTVWRTARDDRSNGKLLETSACRLGSSEREGQVLKLGPPDALQLDEFIEQKLNWQTEESMRGERFFNAMADNQSCLNLDLSHNGLGDKEAVALAKALRKNNTIKRLNLANNHFHADGAREIAEAFQPMQSGGGGGGDERFNKYLSVLNLNNNAIGADGADALGMALGSCESLTELHLVWNNLGIIGVRAIVDCISGKTKFKKLDLRYNEVPGEQDEEPEEGEEDPVEAVQEKVREMRQKGFVVLVDPMYE